MAAEASALHSLYQAATSAPSFNALHFGSTTTSPLLVDRYHSSGEDYGWKKTTKKNNLALSALTLLAFLFFLHILQSCLDDHMHEMKNKHQRHPHIHRFYNSTYPYGLPTSYGSARGEERIADDDNEIVDNSLEVDFTVQQQQQQQQQPANKKKRTNSKNMHKRNAKKNDEMINNN